jgi:opacity protein-like surface antigen
MRKLSVTAALAALLAATPAAAAAPSPRATARSPGGATMNGDLSPWVLLGYNYGAGTGYGFGVRYQAVVVPQGFLHLQNGVHDELGIEFGADFVHYSWGFFGYNWTYNEISPVIGAAWNFWLTPQLCLYPKLDLAFRFGSWSTPNGYPYGHPGGYGGAGLELAAGVAYRIGDRLALRAEAGTYALRFGLAFTL